MKTIPELIKIYEGKVKEAIQQGKIYDREGGEFGLFTNATTDALEAKGNSQNEALNTFIILFDAYLQDFIMQKIRARK